MLDEASIVGFETVSCISVRCACDWVALFFSSMEDATVVSAALVSTDIEVSVVFSSLVFLIIVILCDGSIASCL